jgi:hypothetical protein
MGTAAVNGFYRIAFPNERSFWQWSERIAELGALARDVFSNRSASRAVIFVPQWPAAGKPVRAYVSAGARGVALRMAEGALIDRSIVISAAELPAGLTMLLGSDVDEAEYELGHAWRQCARGGIS